PSPILSRHPQPVSPEYTPMRRAGLLCAPVLLFVSLLTAPADDPPAAAGPVAFRGARIHTAAGKPIDDGVLVIDKGKIVAVGPAGSVTIPRGARVIDAGGRTIIPGLVDTHSHIGIYPKPAVPAHSDGNEGSGAVQSGLRALDAIWPDDPGIKMAVAG